MRSGVLVWPLAILSQSRLTGGLKIRGREEENETTAEGQKILEPQGLTGCCCLGNRKNNMFGKRSAFVLQVLLLWAAPAPTPSDMTRSMGQLIAPAFVIILMFVLILMFLYRDSHRYLRKGNDLPKTRGGVTPSHLQSW